MTTAIITAYDRKFSIGYPASLRMGEYASIHGFSFYCERNPPDGIPVSWYKVEMVLKSLERCERVIWLDADQILTNMSLRPDTSAGFHVSRDWGTDATQADHFSMGAFIAHQDSIPLLMELNSRRDAHLHDDYWEQGQMRDIFRKNDGRGFTVHPRRALCAVPSSMHPTAPEPWQRGDWCAHLTSGTMAERLSELQKL